MKKGFIPIVATFFVAIVIAAVAAVSGVIHPNNPFKNEAILGATGSLSANPNPCTIATGQTTCSSTISWTISGSTADVCVSPAGAADQLFANVGSSGSKDATWVSAAIYTFKLKVPAGTCAGSTIASVDVTGKSATSTTTNTTTNSTTNQTTTTNSVDYKFSMTVNMTNVKGEPLKLAGVKVSIDLTDDAKANMTKAGLPIPQFASKQTNSQGLVEFSAIPRRNYNVTISGIPSGYKLAAEEKNPQILIPNTVTNPSPEDKTAVNFKIGKRNEKPNIVVIMTDDQRWDTLKFMPNVQSELVSKGINFTNYFTVAPLCCPSRSSFLTGLYPHNTGVRTNQAPNGGATKFNDSSTIATWIKSAGYTTSLMGKYLNQYNLLKGRIPPGWDDWHVFVGSTPTGSYFNYTMNENGKVNKFGESESDYSTTVLKNRAVDFIKNNKDKDTPFFLVVTPFAPHTGATSEIPPTVAPRYLGTCKDIPVFRPPSFNEADVSDKEPWVANKSPLDGGPLSKLGEDVNHGKDLSKIEYIDFLRREQICAAKSVDDAVADIIKALGDNINNTMIVYTSDNGYLWGEHRMVGKNCEFDECMRLPLVIRYPSLIKSKGTIDKFVLNIDLAPTFAEIAGVKPSSKVNGVSILSLLTNPNISWRSDFLEEFGLDNYVLRNNNYTYGELKNGVKVLYDDKNDPYQLNNLLSDKNNKGLSSTANGEVQTLTRRLGQLKNE